MVIASQNQSIFFKDKTILLICHTIIPWVGLASPEIQSRHFNDISYHILVFSVHWPNYVFTFYHDCNVLFAFRSDIFRMQMFETFHINAATIHTHWMEKNYSIEEWALFIVVVIFYGTIEWFQWEQYLFWIWEMLAGCSSTCVQCFSWDTNKQFEVFEVNRSSSKCIAKMFNEYWQLIFKRQHILWSIRNQSLWNLIFTKTILVISYYPIWNIWIYS